MTQCIECGSVRPDYAPRCPCGSTHVAQAHPNEETITMEQAWVHGPIACEEDVERLRKIRARNRKKVTANDAPVPIEPYKLVINPSEGSTVMTICGGMYRWDYRITLPNERADLNAYAISFLDTTRNRVMSPDEMTILSELINRMGWHFAWDGKDGDTLRKLKNRQMHQQEEQQSTNTTP